VAQARALGLRPLVHTTTPVDTLVAAEAGAALLAHIPQRGILTDDQVGRLKTLGVPFVTTVRLLAASRELARRGPTPLERSMVDGRVLDAWRREPAWGLRGFSEALDQHFDEVAGDVRTNFRKLLAAGIPLYVGTDSGVHGVFPGSALHSEMRTLVELGMPPLEVLRLTTSAPAAFLDPSGAFGRIAPGLGPIFSSFAEVRAPTSTRSTPSRRCFWTACASSAGASSEHHRCPIEQLKKSRAPAAGRPAGVA
jgi:imidazolonepropionase-like amidohydrolase